MRIATRVIIPTALAAAFIFAAGACETVVSEPKPITSVKPLKSDTEMAPFEKVPAIATYDIITAAAIMDICEEEPLMSEEDIKLIALVTMAEAEGECEQGKRLVIDTILNRVDHPEFPSTVYEVVYQPNQFTSMWNGRVDECEVRTDVYDLVLEELENRTNDEVCFFRTDYYSKYGTPLFQVGNHYFSSFN